MAEIHKDIIMFRSSREINENLHLKMTKENKKTKKQKGEKDNKLVFSTSFHSFLKLNLRNTRVMDTANSFVKFGFVEVFRLTFAFLLDKYFQIPPKHFIVGIIFTSEKYNL